ncbi:hypothetical protein FQN50_001439 [Emmonsiellopsis sp. PD_5]|nr:hypothetical protein FQN50_001439 [Emmonsiellopsis sp. PD_5]
MDPTSETISGFCSLPLDIYLLILDYLTPEDLSSVQLLNHTLGEVARKKQLKLRDKYCSFRLVDSHDTLTGYKTMIKSCTDPLFSRYMRHVVIDCRPVDEQYCPRPTSPIDLAVPDAKEISLIRKMMMKQHNLVDPLDHYLRCVVQAEALDINDPLKATVQYKLANVSVELFPEIFPNIRYVEFADDCWDLFRMKNNNLGKAALYNLRKLEHIGVFNSKRSTTYFDISDLLENINPLAPIKSLRVESTCNVYPSIDTDYRPTAVNLSKIHIIQCRVTFINLRDAIWSAEYLEEFKYTLDGTATELAGKNGIFPSIRLQYPELEKEQWKFNPWALGNELESLHNQTLRVIDIDADKDISDDIRVFERFGQWDSRPCTLGRSIGSFHDYPALTHLSIGIELLLGPRVASENFHGCQCPSEFHSLASRLSPNLEYLCIRGYKKGEYAFHDELISGLRVEKPDLEVWGAEEFIASSTEQQSIGARRA